MPDGSPAAPRPDAAAIEAALGAYDRRDPSPWLALMADHAMPIDAGAKLDLLTCMASQSRQFLLPFVRPLAWAAIILIQVFRAVSPRWPNAPKLLHALIHFGLSRFAAPAANRLILRHFNAATEILAFIADNATPGFRPSTVPLRPRSVDDLRDNVFLDHDLNVYAFVIELNRELDRRGSAIGRVATPDFSAISEDFGIAPQPGGRWNGIDVQTAIELYTPVYAALLSDRDFWRASNSLQLDETLGLYAARILGQEHYLGLVNNKHPLVPITTLQAGFRLMLHGVATEFLHGTLRRMKAAQAAAAATDPAQPQAASPG